MNISIPFLVVAALVVILAIRVAFREGKVRGYLRTRICRPCGTFRACPSCKQVGSPSEV